MSTTTPNPDDPSPRQPALAPTAAELREIARSHRKTFAKYGEGQEECGRYWLNIAFACDQCADRIDEQTALPELKAALAKERECYQSTRDQFSHFVKVTEECRQILVKAFEEQQKDEQSPKEQLLDLCLMVASATAALAAVTKQISTIEDFLWGRKYCTELYISPLGFNGGEAWQVELNWGDGTEAFQGESVAEALAKAIVAAMQRSAQHPAPPSPGGDTREEAK